MSLQEVQLLLQKYNLTPNKLLGQNFLIDSSLFPKLNSYAALNSNDIVLDAGAGLGFLSKFIASKCKIVLAVEKDPKITKILSEQVKDLTNVSVIEGDILDVEVPFFNKTVSLPPYYLSSQLITWLSDHDFECAILVVQKEFANRLIAQVGSEEYGWLKVITFPYFQVEVLDEVPKWMFHPQPEVDSVIMRLKPWAEHPFKVKDVGFFRRLTKWLFSQRNKKVGNSVASFIRAEYKVPKVEAERIASVLTLKERRARDLSPEEFGELANALVK
jgi:16S rRNA (adenine1518-N6/adenine1519-N6)-dimethyltransferase